MGNKLCYSEDERQFKTTTGQKIIPITTVTIQSKIYNLTPEAQATYIKLQTQFNDNPFLDLPAYETQYNTIEYRNGLFQIEQINTSYNGQWNTKTKKPEGRGRIILAQGSILIGHFKEYKCNSQLSYFVFKDGSFYRGEIRENKFQGKGKLVHQQFVYQGMWSDNKPHGQGVEIAANGDKYTGPFINGLKYGKTGTYVWNKHKKYTQYKGQFQLGKICGKGILTLNNGTAIQGFFDQNTIDNAICISSVLQCKGSFIRGKLQGKGSVQIISSKEQFNGSFKDGELYGNCVYKDVKQRKNDCFIFKGKKLKSVVGLPDDEIQKILETLEEVYNTVTSHSQALAKVREQLKEYNCQFIKPFENYFQKQHYLIINFHQETLLVKKK